MFLEAYGSHRVSLRAALCLSLISVACGSGDDSGGEAGRGGEGGAGGEVCRGPLEAYCSPCDPYEVAFTDALEGLEICSGDGALGTLPAAGACDELRWIVTWDTLDQHLEYFDADGTMVGATLRTDVASLCDGSSFTKDYGVVPECEHQAVVRACEPIRP